MPSIHLSKEDAKALLALRRSPFAPRVKAALERQLEAARDVYELTTPADDELRYRVLEIKTAYNMLFVDDIVQEN